MCGIPVGGLGLKLHKYPRGVMKRSVNLNRYFKSYNTLIIFINPFLIEGRQHKHKHSVLNVNFLVESIVQSYYYFFT